MYSLNFERNLSATMLVIVHAGGRYNPVDQSLNDIGQSANEQGGPALLMRRKIAKLSDRVLSEGGSYTIDRTLAMPVLKM